MTADALRADADRREAAVRAALTAIGQRHGEHGARLRIDLSPADALAQCERDRLLADCIDALAAPQRVAVPLAREGLLVRFAALGGGSDE